MASLRAVSVPAKARGERVDAFLAKALPDFTRSRLKSLIEDGKVLLGGKPAKAAYRLKGGEALTVEPAPLPPSTATAEALPIQILHEDKHLLVLNKSAGMVVHPALGNWSGTLVNALLHHLKDERGLDSARAGLVHRLDKDTSGCLVVAKTQSALAALQAEFKARKVDKIYRALVLGSPPPEGEIDTLYGRHPTDRKRFSGKVREGKRALTRYRTLESYADGASLEVTLLTGRTHQIRAHLFEAGFPLLGDKLYGVRAKRKGMAAEAESAVGRQALHAFRLCFNHPATGKALEFEAPIPEEFLAAQKLLASAR